MSIKNPTEKNCWAACVSCHRCADKGKWASCAGCSGRFDPARRIYADPDDVCNCREGILRWKTQKGRMIVAKIPTNPFEGHVEGQRETADERQYQQYLQQMREKRNNEQWDPIQFEGGGSTSAWNERYNRGY